MENISADAHRWKLFSARDPELRLGLKNSRRRNAHIVVVLQSRADQFLKLRILEHLPPLFVTKRLGSECRVAWFCLILVGLRLRFRSAGRCPAVHAGNIDRRSS